MCLYVSDLDGTLLDNQGKISIFSREALVRLLKKGVLFTLATARSVHSVKEILGEVDLPFPIVGGNGTLLSDFASGKHLDILALTQVESATIFQIARESSLSPIAAVYDNTVSRIIYQDIPNRGMAWCIAEREAVGDKRLQRVKDVAGFSGDAVVSVTFIGTLPETQRLQLDIAAALPTLSVILYENTYTPGWHWLTLQHPDADKGSGLIRLMKHSEIENASVIAFGDNHNDLPLFSVAGTAVAVANAVTEVRDAADEVIGYNYEDAVMKYILERT